MDKKKQMIEYMIQDLVEMISEEQNLDYDFAMWLLYDSELYNKLLDTETELYRESPAYVYGLFQDELNFGHIVQAEVWKKYSKDSIGYKIPQGVTTDIDVRP